MYRYTLYPNGTLEIRNLDLPDAGKYQCFARNPAGETYKAVWLKVNSKYCCLISCCLILVSSCDMGLYLRILINLYCLY